MDLFFHSTGERLSRRDAIFFLACAWVLGLIFGSATAFQSSHSLFSLMRMTAASPVSIVGLLSVILLPLFCSAFAVYISCRWLLIPIAFLEAFFYAYYGLGILAAYGSAGWLIRLLLIFSDTLTLPVLWTYWIRSIRREDNRVLLSTVPAFSAALLIGSIDYSIISPFLAQILL